MNARCSNKQPSTRFAAAVLAGFALLAYTGEANGQLSYTRGQRVSPAYEGFEVNPDGSFNMVFGYMNVNWLEEPDAAIGPDNNFSPGPPDRGQPTHFLPRRNRFIFKVPVPADFGDQELVWTLTTNGETRRVYGSLRLDLRMDNMTIASETGALGSGGDEARSNRAPVIEIEGQRVRSARVGELVTLISRVTDDGIPTARQAARARAGADTGAQTEVDDETSPELLALERALNEPSRGTLRKVRGLHFKWFVYRGEGSATFEPIQIKPWEDNRAFQNAPWAPFWEAPAIPDGDRWVVRVAFDEPGTYVLRGRADDGFLHSDEEVTIHVTTLLP